MKFLKSISENFDFKMFQLSNDSCIIEENKHDTLYYIEIDLYVEKCAF